MLRVLLRGPLRAPPLLAVHRRCASSAAAGGGGLVRLELLSGADAGLGVLTLDAPSSRNVLYEAALVALRAAAAEAAAQPPAALRVQLTPGATEDSRRAQLTGWEDRL